MAILDSRAIAKSVHKFFDYVSPLVPLYSNLQIFPLELGTKELSHTLFSDVSICVRAHHDIIFDRSCSYTACSFLCVPSLSLAHSLV